METHLKRSAASNQPFDDTVQTKLFFIEKYKYLSRVNSVFFCKRLEYLKISNRLLLGCRGKLIPDRLGMQGCKR